MPDRLLFPLAAAFAVTVVPLWLGLRNAYPAVADPLWHGHEMIYGFALAVIAGFLATRPARATTWMLAGTWLVARIATGVEHGPLTLPAGLSFTVTVLVFTAPPLLAAAKRPRNLILPAILVALLVADATWWIGAIRYEPALQARALLVATDVLALLLLVMGGRVLRAAAGNCIEQQGGERREYGQRSRELSLAALAACSAAFDAAGLHSAAGMLCTGAALLATLNMYRWQLHRTLAQPQVWSLAAGYFWLVAGLALKGSAQLVEGLPAGAMLHGIGIGALGTLTLVMMARTSTLRARKPFSGFGDIGNAALLVSAAALGRIGAPLMPDAQHVILWLSAAAWCGAFLILFARLLRGSRHEP